MRKQICSLALSTLFGLGMAVAATQDAQPANAPSTQDPSIQSQNTKQGRHHRFDPNRQVKFMTKRLNLTADQQNQLLPILTARQQQFESIRSDSSLSKEDRRAKMRAAREDSEGKIKALLTDDQKQTYDQMQQQMRERMKQHREEQQNNTQGTGTAG
jgi:hypothetical protein